MQTDLDKLESQLRASKEALRSCEFRLEVLEDENKRARSRVAVLQDQFLSIVSHELRTPIHVLIGFGGMLQRGLAGALEPKQADVVHKMMAVSTTLAKLLDDLLDMSQVQAGTFEVKPVRMSLGEIVGESVGLLAPLAQAKQVDLRCEVDDGAPACLADRDRIQQVLVNLINNAVKFTPAGGSVRVRTTRAGSGLACEIEDTGIGILPDDLPRLFQPFTQLDMSLSREAGGIGIGLAISKAIVEAHGGTIGVRSQVGVGSTFWLTLPLAV